MNQKENFSLDFKKTAKILNVFNINNSLLSSAILIPLNGLKYFLKIGNKPNYRYFDIIKFEAAGKCVWRSHF
jgi:hypothetical protein